MNRYLETEAISLLLLRPKNLKLSETLFYFEKSRVAFVI